RVPGDPGGPRARGPARRDPGVRSLRHSPGHDRALDHGRAGGAGELPGAGVALPGRLHHDPRGAPGPPTLHEQGRPVTPMPGVPKALMLALALAGCNKAESAGNGDAGGGGAGGGPPAMPVEVAVARTDTVVDAILATGQVEAMQSIELRPDIEGRIAQILVREGAYVAQGAPLF